ncbi:hypothetical protein N9139_01695 [Akkermansiaceae bacterium]|nr:hypothetical protein [Akkermansiaceae bacterium]
MTALAVPYASAATRTWNGSLDTDYNNTANWSGTDVPDGDDSGILQGDGTGETLLSGGIDPGNASALNVRGGHILNIDNDGGSLSVTNNVNVGRGVVGDGSTVNHSAGAFNIGGLDMSGNATGGTSFYNLSGTAALSLGPNGGTRNLNLGGPVGVGDFDSTFAISGDTATVTLNDRPALLNSSAIVVFTLGASGIDAIDTTEVLTLEAGAELVVDGTSYTGGIATIPLFTFGSRAVGTEAIEFTEVITGFAGLQSEIVYNGTSIDLVLSMPGGAFISSFTADVTQINSGDPVTLSWMAENETTLTLDPGGVDVLGQTSLVVNPSVTTTYTLTASGGGNTNSQSIEILVGPQINSFTADPLLTPASGSSTLSWDVDFATSLTLNPGNVDVSGLSSFEVSPTATTTYTLTASDGTTTTDETIEIIITPEILSFATLDPNIESGQSTLLEWNAVDFTSLTLDTGLGDVTSLTQLTVTPAVTTTYTLVATNADASVESQFTVVVGPTLSSFEADQSLVPSGSDVTLNWTTEGFTSLTLDPGNVNVSALNSTVITNVTADTTFTLTATDSGGISVSETVSIAIISDYPVITAGPTISVNFHTQDGDALADHQVEAGETAGFIPVDGAFWTNINIGAPGANSGPLFASTDLMSNTGTPVAATIVPSVDSTYFVGYAASGATGAAGGVELGLEGNDDDLFNSYLALNGPSGDGSPADAAVLNISGLGAPYTSGYTLIIYADSDRRTAPNGNNVRQSFYTLTPAGGSPVTAFVEDDDPSMISNLFDGTYVFGDGVEDGADYANFTIIEGLTAASFTLEASSPDGGRGALSGFQIVATNPAPLAITSISHDVTGGTPAVTLVFNSVPGKEYAIDFSTSLTSGSWTETADFLATDAVSEYVDTIEVANNPDKLFYRVRLLN